MTSGKLIVLGISILFFIATETLFSSGTDPTGKQKHFWATIFMIFSLILGLPIESSFETQVRIEELKQMLKNHEDTSAKLGKFQDLLALYEDNFGQAEPALKGWADETLTYLRDNWSHGVMPLPKEFAADKIGQVYHQAQMSIIATNVGSTKFYFDVHTYADLNIYARDHGIPVVRFYIYGKKYKDMIEMRDGRHPTDINEFFAEVKDLHARLGSLYSAVIDIDRVRLEEYRDLLIMDNKFVAETKLSPEWEPLRALATENEDQLKTARQYFHVLMGALDERFILRMKPEDVRKFFKNGSFPPSGGKDPADALFNYLMGQITGV